MLLLMAANFMSVSATVVLSLCGRDPLTQITNDRTILKLISVLIQFVRWD